MTYRPIFTAVLLLLPAFFCFASTDVQEHRVYQTTKISGEIPDIDGFINDNAWQSVDWSGNFTQRSPNDGEEPSQQTSFKILYDNDYLYIAIRAHDSEPENIVTRLLNCSNHY